MASFVVDGLVIPIAINADPTLDFCNTRAGWGDPAPKEYLRSYDHLATWARENDLLTASAAAKLRRLGTAQPRSAHAIVERAVALREALYAVLVGAPRPKDWVVVNAEVRAAAAAFQLVPDGRTASWLLRDQSILDSPLSAVAWSAAHLLTSPGANQISACPGNGCGWVFANPRGQRRWCSMAWCGNRNKVRRHAERIRGG